MNLLNFIDKGGAIAYILVALNIIGFTIILWKLIEIKRFKSKKNSNIAQDIVDRFLDYDTDKHIIIETAKTEIEIELKPLYTGLTTIEIIASIAPLLGLLGTVIGIFQAFSVIAVSGLDDAAGFASGIQLALITTVIGMIVSIPHVIFYNYISNSIENNRDAIENNVLHKLSEIYTKEDKKELS